MAIGNIENEQAKTRVSQAPFMGICRLWSVHRSSSHSADRVGSYREQKTVTTPHVSSQIPSS